jgi:hypothetical protein
MIAGRGRVPLPFFIAKRGTVYRKKGELKVAKGELKVGKMCFLS